jgi:hypothetical protein
VSGRNNLQQQQLLHPFLSRPGFPPAPTGSITVSSFKKMDARIKFAHDDG